MSLLTTSACQSVDPRGSTAHRVRFELLLVSELTTLLRFADLDDDLANSWSDQNRLEQSVAQPNGGSHSPDHAFPGHVQDRNKNSRAY